MPRRKSMQMLITMHCSVLTVASAGSLKSDSWTHICTPSTIKTFRQHRWQMCKPRMKHIGDSVEYSSAFPHSPTSVSLLEPTLQLPQEPATMQLRHLYNLGSWVRMWFRTFLSRKNVLLQSYTAERVRQRVNSPEINTRGQWRSFQLHWGYKWEAMAIVEEVLIP